MQAMLLNLKHIGARGLGAPLVIVMLLAIIVLPLPPFLLDLFFTFNIALSLVVLLVVVYALRPLDFGLFLAVAQLLAYVFQLQAYQEQGGDIPQQPDEFPVPEELRHE